MLVIKTNIARNNGIMEFFDSHAHYKDEKFDIDRDEVIFSVRAEGITRLVSAGYSVESSEFAKQISENYDFIFHSCGISPNDIPQTEEELWKNLNEIRKIAKQKHEKLVAIGEIGLVYYWN